MVFTEMGRTVTVERQRKQISICVRIAYFAEERDKRVIFTGIISLCYAVTYIGPYIVRSKDREVFSVAEEVAVAFPIQLYTNHDVSTMPVYFQPVSGNSILHPFGPMLLFGFHSTLTVAGLCSFLTRIGEVTGLLVCVVQTKSRANIEPFEEA